MNLEEATEAALAWLKAIRAYGVTTSAPEALYWGCPKDFSIEELESSLIYYRANKPIMKNQPTIEAQELELDEPKINFDLDTD